MKVNVESILHLSTLCDTVIVVPSLPCTARAGEVAREEERGRVAEFEMCSNWNAPNTEAACIMSGLSYVYSLDNLYSNANRRPTVCPYRAFFSGQLLTLQLFQKMYLQ